MNYLKYGDGYKGVKEKMIKEALKYGNVVETKEGHRYFVPAIIKSVLIGLTEENNLLTEYIKDDLSNEYSKLDIMKVYEDYTCSKLLWERPKELLTEEEKEYLKEIFKGLTCKVIGIFRGNYYLEIKLENDCYINLAKYNCMKFKFEGMETCRKYTLEELGLEE